MARIRLAALTTFVIAGAATIGVAGNASGAGVKFQAASDGQSIVSALEFDLLTARGPDGWTSDQLAPGEYRYFSRDLSCRILTSPEPLALGAPTEVGDNLFRREPDGSHTLLSNLAPTNATGVAADHQYGPVNVSADCGHVVFQTPYVYPGLGASGLYEWTDGTLRNVGVLPDGGVAAGATLGAAGGNNMWNAVSTDGSRIFFSATSNDGDDAGKKAVFVRADGATTVEASASKTAIPSQGAVYQFASKTGSHVLFLANYGLTSSTSSGPTDGKCALSPSSHCDLYDYDVEIGELTNLSAHTGYAQGAMVAGVLGASDDASHVYFAARAQLLPGKGRNVVENIARGSYNVYLAHDGQRSFVGVLEAPEVLGGSNRNGALISRSTAPSSPWASRVTPDGRYLLFPSTADVFDYHDGGVADAFLYSADADETVCISCRRGLEPSVGSPPGSESPTTPLASDGSVGHDNPLNPPRTLSADGKHAFFQKPDVFTSGAVEGRDNVYEWNESQIVLLAAGSAPGATHPTRFEDASDDGDDVFVSTLDRLVPRDVDDSVDVYDLRVDGGLAQDAVAPPSCDPLQAGCPGFAPPFQQAPPVAPPPRRAAFSVKGLLRAQRVRLVAGRRVKLSVRVSRAGRVSVEGVAAVAGARATVFAGARKAKRRGTVRIPVALTKAALAQIAKAGSLKVTMTVSFSGVRKKVVRSIVLRRPARAGGAVRRSA